MGGGTTESGNVGSLEQQQQNKELAKAFASQMQNIGANVARPMPSYQAPQGGMTAGAQMPSGQQGAVPDIAAAIGPLFGSAGGISQEELARILAGLGYR